MVDDGPVDGSAGGSAAAMVDAVGGIVVDPSGGMGRAMVGAAGDAVDPTREGAVGGPTGVDE